MANGFIPAELERAGKCGPVKAENRAFLGGVLGIDINGERQPISEGGIVDLTFVMDETEAAAAAAAQSAAEAETAREGAETAQAAAQGSQSAAAGAASDAQAAQAQAEAARDSARSYQNNAQSYAQTAQAYSASAVSAKTDAQTSKTQAESAATLASGYKADAASSATAAAGFATAAATSATNAAGSATAAAGSASDAAASATQAGTFATDAAASATAAQTAQTAAETAQAGAEAAEAHAMQVLPDAVADWLDDHVDPATGYVIDDTLTIQDAAADAKTVGDIVGTLAAEKPIDDKSLWKRNTIGIGGGTSAIGTTGRRFESSTTRLAINPVIPTDGYRSITLTPASGYQYYLYLFDSALTTVVLASGWLTTAGTYYVGNGYMSVLIAKVGNTTITLDDYDKVAIKVEIPDGRISEIESNLENVPAEDVYAGFAQFNDAGMFVRKTVGVSSGKIHYESSTIRIASFPPAKVTSKTYRIIPNAGYQFILFTLSDDATFSPSYETQRVWRTEEHVYEIPEGITHIVLMIGKTGDTAITTSDYDKVTVIAYEDMQDVVDDLYAKLPTTLPDYWTEYLTTKQPTLTAADAALGFNGVSFAFVTDVHINTNNKISPLLLKYLTTHTSIRDVVCGGDIVTNYNTKANAEKELQWWASETSELDIVNLHGNHDNNSNGQTDNTQTLTNAEFYALECRPAENYVHFAPGHLYGYRDNEAQKVRYIYLDTGAPDAAVISSTQITWMTARISELADGWTVVVFAHQFWSGANASTATLTLDGNGTAIMNALDSIYDSIAATIACVVVGHCHRDYSMTSAKGYPIIATTCDAGGTAASTYDPDQNTRTPGTTTEQALDLYYIDTANKTIKTIRIGAGDTTKDRSFTY